MYLRLVHVKVRPEMLPFIPQAYDERIIPRLEEMSGCLYAGLVLSESHKDECISMTLWDTRAHAEDYEKSGLFGGLLEEAKPYLSDSSVWKIQLSEEMKLEYRPVPEEAVVKSYSLAAEPDAEIPDRGAADSMYLRIVSLKVKPGKTEELRRIFADEVIPALRSVRGCRYANLTESIEEKDGAVSLTVWDSKQDSDAYEASGRFDQMTDRIKHALADLFQWKMALERESGRRVATSEDLAVEHYSIVSGRRLRSPGD